MENQPNQKNNLPMILLISSLLTVIGVLGFFLVKKDKKTEVSTDSAGIDNVQENGELAGESQNQKDEENKISYTEYVNQSYGYSVKFPDNWYMNNDLSEAKLQEKEIDDEGKKMLLGGQTFWSNYKDINKYNPSNKPADFRLLALAVYKDETSKSIEEFAVNLGFDSDSQKDPFEIGDMKGIEFVTAGLVQGNPRVAIIYQKDSLFYVFNLGFIGGNKNAAEEMEKIAGTLTFTQK